MMNRIARILRGTSSLDMQGKVDPATAEVIATAQRMMACLSAAPAIYRPSLFWSALAQENLTMLAGCGIGHFKRSLSQNYFNWPVEAPVDPQMHSLLRAWAEDPSAVPLAAELRGNSRLGSVNSTVFINNPTAARVYTLYVGLLWWFASRHDPDGLAARLAEPAAGDPVPIFLGDRVISQDLANSLREFRRFQAPLMDDPKGPVLAEIGAGYGRLGAVARTGTGCRLWVIDIAPALAISQWYLPSVFPDAKVFRWRPFTTWADIAEEAQAAELAFFTVDQLPMLPDDSVSVFATVSALHEMKPDQISSYLADQARMTRRAIYTKNWTSWRNPVDEFQFESSMIPAPAGWSTDFDRIDDVLSSFTEKLFLRD